jgi:hypothetical protein
MNINAVWKPWYVYRPHQLARRLATSLAAPSRGHRLMPVSWGVEIYADPAEHVGRCVWTTGIFDLAVSEVLFRVTRRSDLMIDVGAKLGYMALLGAVASGPNGRVLAFEPNPRVARWLEENVERARHHYEMAPIEIHATALGAIAGTATIATLDDAIAGRDVGVMKVDVEGHTPQVLEGAAEALHAHRIRDIVFEDHQGKGSGAMTLLLDAGYDIFAIGWSMRGPILAPVSDGSLASAYEAPSYLATTEPRAALDACAAQGWAALQHQSRALEEAIR